MCIKSALDEMLKVAPLILVNYYVDLNRYLDCRKGSMSLRAYIKIDLPLILDIYNQSKLDELKFENAEFELLSLEEDEERYSKLMESEIFVYQTQDQISGFGAIHENEIRALFVHPNSRGKGIGKDLIEFLLSNIQGEACLYVASSNHPAKNLYQQYGFSVTDNFETTYNQVPVVVNKMILKK